MSETATWQPSAPIPNLLKRAAVMAEIRRFFTDRGVLEVETPCMSQATVTDIHLFPFETRFVGPGHSQGLNLYLMTSPEYHMKRLLAAGCGPVFQLCRSFRNEEMGRHHNPEFTMLEWYRPCYDMYRLINEVDDLLQQVLECQPAESLSYQQAFQRHLDIDPLSADKAQLREVAAKLDLSNIADTEEDRDTLLQLLFTMGVEPHIGKDRPTFIYHFPATQASLAQISPEDHRVAERFEVYYKGIELANGFHELTDAREQRLRFEQDNRKRAARGLPQQPIDNNLLAALEASEDTEYLAIHDGARPLILPEQVDEMIRLGQRTYAVAPALPVTDTVKVADLSGLVLSTPDRSTLFAVQTPQVFQASILKAALQSAIDAEAPITDDCSAVERLGKEVYLTPGWRENIKITTPEDLAIAEAFLRRREVNQ